MQKMLLTLVSLFALTALVACGGGSSNYIAVPPNPSGGNNAGYSNASLKGNYVFAVNGSTTNNAFAVAGVFSADGSGNISSGVRDTVNDSGGQTFNEPIIGSYSVNQDGRGQMVLNGSSGQVIYRFVLQSTTSLLSPVVGNLFQDGTTSNNVIFDAIGRIEAQSTPTAITGPFVLRLDGEDINLLAYGGVGALTLTGGNVANGTIDENDAGIFNPQLGVSSGSYSFTPNGRGSLSYVTPGSTATTVSPQGSHNFVAYYVSPNRLELLSTDRKFYLHGFAEMQAATVAGTTATFTGGQVFNISGIDSNGNAAQETGRFTLDGAGNLANGVEDFNDGGNLSTNASFTGTYTVNTTGRWQASLNFSTTSLTLVGWQVSPQRSVVLTTSSTLLETGSMRAQTLGLTNASVTGNYGENLAGFDFNTGNGTLQNFESTGNFSADGAGALSGTVDTQTDVAGISVDVGTSGSYTVDPTAGRGTGFLGNVPVSIYTVDANTMYLFSTDSTTLYQGMMVKQ